MRQQTPCRADKSPQGVKPRSLFFTMIPFFVYFFANVRGCVVKTPELDINCTPAEDGRIVFHVRQFEKVACK